MKQANEQSAPNTIDPSSFTDTPATPLVYETPPTAADQEATPSASITNEMSKETGATMNVNDYLWSCDRNMEQKETQTTGEQL